MVKSSGTISLFLLLAVIVPFCMANNNYVKTEGDEGPDRPRLDEAKRTQKLLLLAEAQASEIERKDEEIQKLRQAVSEMSGPKPQGIWADRAFEVTQDLAETKAKLEASRRAQEDAREKQGPLVIERTSVLSLAGAFGAVRVPTTHAGPRAVAGVAVERNHRHG